MRLANRARTRGGLGFITFAAVDARRHRTPQDDALAPRDATGLLSARDAIVIPPSQDVVDGNVNDAVRRGVHGPLDVVLDLRAIPDPVLPSDLARSGSGVLNQCSIAP